MRIQQPPMGPDGLGRGTQAPVTGERTLPHLPDLAATLDALRATGASQGEALGLAVRAFGEEAVRPAWDRWTRRVSRTDTLILRLDAVAANAPEVCDAWFAGWLATHPAPGTLDLAGRNWVTHLPEGLVTDTLDLRETAITALPADLRITGSLILDDTLITVLPKGLVRVPGVLSLNDCAIAFLSEGLEVGIDLDLCRTPIDTLPQELTVRGSLHLRASTVRILPEGLTVGGHLDLEDCADLRALPAGLRVGGTLCLTDSGLEHLSDNLQVDGHLGLWHTRIRSLPRGLRVGEGLGLGGCTAWDGKIPEDAVIAGRIYTDRTPTGGLDLAAWRDRFPHGEPPGGGAHA